MIWKNASSAPVTMWQGLHEHMESVVLTLPVFPQVYPFQIPLSVTAAFLHNLTYMHTCTLSNTVCNHESYVSTQGQKQ